MPISMIGNRSLSNEEKNRAKELQERNIPSEDIAYKFFPQSIRNKVVRNIPAAFMNHAAFYPDFLLWNEKILIEIDDWQHDYEPRMSMDMHRDKVFKENGYEIVPFNEKADVYVINNELNYNNINSNINNNNNNKKNDFENFEIINEFEFHF